MANSVQAGLLQATAQHVGGPQKLADALGVRPIELACWMASLKDPPRAVVLQALEIFLRHEADVRPMARR
jgi:hypothetical protein